MGSFSDRIRKSERMHHESSPDCVRLARGPSCQRLGFSRGWFSFTSDSGDAKSNITLTVDQNKFQEDRKAVVENVQGMERRAKDAVAGPGEKKREGTIINVIGGELTMTDKEGKEHRIPWHLTSR